MKRYYFTYFDRNYLIKGMALIESLLNREQDDFDLFVICVDEYTRLLLNRLDYENLRLIPLHEIEHGNTALHQAKRNRNLVEYYWSLKAAFALYILERHPAIDILTYFDADLFFYSTPQPIFEEIDDHSVLIHQHRFAPEQKFMEKWGRYNAGFISVRNDTYGRRALRWWRDQCMQWCCARLEDGKYGDQLYLNTLAEKCEGVGELGHIGAGVAPWNHIQYDFSRDAANNVYVNKIPLVFYHFHSLTFVEPDIVIPSKYISNPLSLDILKNCFVPYVDQLQKSIAKVRELVPDFKSGLFASKILTEMHTFIAARSQAERIKSSNLPQVCSRLDGTWDCYGSDQLRDATRWNRYVPPNPTGPETTPDSEANLSHNALLYAKSEYEQGNKEAAISLLRQFTEKWPGNWLMEMTLGEMLWNEGEQEAAVENLLKTYWVKPNETQVAAKLFNMLIQTDQLKTGRQAMDDDGHGCRNRLCNKRPPS